MSIKIKKILEKKNKKKIVSLTAYSKNIAKILDKHCDITLVGDSLANVLYGMKNTHKLSLNTVIHHSISVRAATKNSLMVVDMPKGSYSNPIQAKKNAKLLKKKTKCDAVKIESNKKNFKIIREIIKAKIPVMGHIGLRPQSVHTMGGYKVQRDEERLLSDALAVQQAGAFSVVLECVPAELAEKITEQLEIPTIGIGAGNQCDGQVLVLTDMLGLTPEAPRFVKQYADLQNIISTAATQYRQEVESGDFPGSEHSYK